MYWLSGVEHHHGKEYISLVTDVFSLRTATGGIFLHQTGPAQRLPFGSHKGKLPLLSPRGTSNIGFWHLGCLTHRRFSRHLSMMCWETWQTSSYMSTWMTYRFFPPLSRNIFSTSDVSEVAREWAFCQGSQSVPFLGFIISSEGLRMDPDKIWPVVEWPI